MQTVLRQPVGERSPRLIACHAEMEPRQSGEGDWYNEAAVCSKPTAVNEEIDRHDSQC